MKKIICLLLLSLIINSAQCLAVQNIKSESNSQYKTESSFMNYAVFSSANKYGLFNLINGKKILPIEYDSIKINQQNKTFTATANGKQTVYKIYKNIILPDFDYIEEDGKYLILTKDNKKGLYIASADIGEIFPVEYQVLQKGYYDSIILKKGNKYGVVKKSDPKTTILPLAYDYLEQSSKEPFGFKVVQGGKTGYVAPDGKTMIPCEYDKLIRLEKIEKDNSYLATITKRNKQGLLKIKDGNVSQIIPPIFDEIIELKRPTTYYIVKNYNRYGIYDSINKILAIPVQFDKIIDGQYISDNKTISTFIVYKDRKKGVYSIWDCRIHNEFKPVYNKLFVPVEFDRIKIAPQGCIVTRKNKKGYYHIDKGIFMPVQYDDITISKDYNKYTLTAVTSKKTIKKTLPINKADKKINSELKKIRKIIKTDNVLY